MRRLHYLIWLALPAICGFGQSMRQSGLIFEANAGQADPSVQFIARTPAHTMLLMRDGVVLKSHTGAARIQFSGANAAIRAEGLQPLAGKGNYFLGNKPENWIPHVAQFGRVRYKNIYDGVDL